MLFTQELAMKRFHWTSGILVYILAIASLRFAETFINDTANKQTRQQSRHD